MISLLHSSSDSDKILFLTMEGNIGVGKSTLMSHLKQIFASHPVIFIDEPVKEWEDAGLLQAMYDRNLAPAFFQYAALGSIVSHTLAAINSAPPGTKLFIAERSMHSNLLVFGKASLSERIEKRALEYVWNHLMTVLPSNIVYQRILLKAFPGTCLSRIRHRARASESSIHIAYLEKLHDLHGIWMAEESVLDPVPSGVWRIVDAEQDQAALLAQTAALVMDLLASVKPWNGIWFTSHK